MIAWETFNKHCADSRCRQVKPSTEFYRNRARPDGLDHLCKACRKRWDDTPQQIASARFAYETRRTIQAVARRRLHGQPA